MIKTINPALAKFAISANTCKSDSCENLGIVNAPDYISPSYYLGFPAVHCKKCGSNALLLDDNDINSLLLPKIDFYLTEVKNGCPNCYHQQHIQYGKTAQSTPRQQCKNCLQVYSPKRLSDTQQQKLIILSQLLLQHFDFKTIINKLGTNYNGFYRLLNQLAYVCTKNSLLLEQAWLKHNHSLHIATKSHTIQAKGKYSAPIYLWGITSGLSDSGYILLNTLNYTDESISQTSLYDGKRIIEPEKYPATNLEQLKQRYDVFLNRKSFDQLSYHPRPFNYGELTIIEPVISAYAHFNQLKFYYPSDEIFHYIEHEIVLRSAAITTYAPKINHKKCSIFYLHDIKKLAHDVTHIHHHKIGWWDNHWYTITNTTSDTYRLLGLLTPNHRRFTNKQIAQLPASFNATDHFYHAFLDHFPSSRLIKLNPATIQLLMTIFTGFYNFCLSDIQQKTTAEQAGIINERLTIKQFIQCDNESNLSTYSH